MSSSGALTGEADSWLAATACGRRVLPAYSRLSSLTSGSYVAGVPLPLYLLPMACLPEQGWGIECWPVIAPNILWLGSHRSLSAAFSTSGSTL